MVQTSVEPNPQGSNPQHIPYIFYPPIKISVVVKISVCVCIVVIGPTYLIVVIGPYVKRYPKRGYERIRTADHRINDFSFNKSQCHVAH